MKSVENEFQIIHLPDFGPEVLTEVLKPVENEFQIIHLPDFSTEVLTVVLNLLYQGNAKLNLGMQQEVWKTFRDFGLFHINEIGEFKPKILHLLIILHIKQKQNCIPLVYCIYRFAFATLSFKIKIANSNFGP